MTKLKVLELYSGIGGMHFALKGSGLDAEVKEAADINTVANTVYKYNFPNTKISNKNILALTASEIDDLEVDMILMSPPCQPYTRLGKMEDTCDRRSDSLMHLIDIIPKAGTKLKYILLENVRGFEKSESRSHLIKSLKPKFHILEFLLNPLQFGIPNSRERYYLLARQDPFTSPIGELITDPAVVCTPVECFPIKDVLEFCDESEMYDKHLLPENVLFRRAMVMDILTKESKRSCCFTKAYGRYIEGTGSVYCPLDKNKLKDTFEQIKTVNNDSKKEELLSSLRLRFFSPKEVSGLMCFPENFEFPKSITNRQRYNLLGNSVNVKVVSSLIQFLVNG